MRNPFQVLLKASKLLRRRRPISAARVLQDFLLPAPKRVWIAKPRKKPAASSLPKPPPGARIRPAVRPQPSSFSDGNHSGLAYKLYVPSRTTRRRLPLVVMLHGCRQSAGDLAAGTRMNRLADEFGVIVLYPAQSAGANALRCWNWHRPGDQRRGGGETAALAALTRAIVSLAKADPARIYVAGLSAGGTAAANLAAAYPDIFVAVGVHSSVAPGYVRSLGGALATMRNGIGAVEVSRQLPTVPIIVFQGDQDNVVHPSNIHGFAAKLQHAGPDQSITSKCRSGSVTRTDWRDRRGEVMLEQWLIHGGGHAWSGGDPAGSFADPSGPDASREMLRFFLARKRPPVVQKLAGGKAPKA